MPEPKKFEKQFFTALRDIFVGAKVEQPNHDPSRCLNAATILRDSHTQCHLYEWKRKY